MPHATPLHRLIIASLLPISSLVLGAESAALRHPDPAFSDALSRTHARVMTLERYDLDSLRIRMQRDAAEMTRINVKLAQIENRMTALRANTPTDDGQRRANAAALEDAYRQQSSLRMESIRAEQVHAASKARYDTLNDAMRAAQNANAAAADLIVKDRALVAADSTEARSSLEAARNTFANAEAEAAWLARDLLSVTPEKPYIIQLYAGGTANYWGNPVDPTDKGPNAYPEFGIQGFHTFFRPERLEGLRWLTELEVRGNISYRGVTVDQGLATLSGPNAGIEGLTSARSVGAFVDPEFYFLHADTFSVGVGFHLGYEFFQDEKFRRDAQNTYGGEVKVKDDEDGNFYFRAGVGRAEYLRGNRLVFDMQLPLRTIIDYDAKKVHKGDYSDIYLTFSFNTRPGAGDKSDALAFGVKYIISTEKILSALDPRE